MTGILVREALAIQQNLLRAAAIAIIWCPSPLARTRLWRRYKRVLGDDQLGLDGVRQGRGRADGC